MKLIVRVTRKIKKIKKKLKRKRRSQIRTLIFEFWERKAKAMEKLQRKNKKTKLATFLFDKYILKSWLQYCKQMPSVVAEKKQIMSIPNNELILKNLKRKERRYRLAVAGYFRKELKRQIKKNKERILRLRWTPRKIKKETFEMVSHFKKLYRKRERIMYIMRTVKKKMLSLQTYRFLINNQTSSYIWQKHKFRHIMSGTSLKKKKKIKSKIRINALGIRRHIIC